MAKHLRYPAGKLCPMCYQLNDAAVGTQPRGESAENGRKHGAVEYLYLYRCGLPTDRETDKQKIERLLSICAAQRLPALSMPS